MQRRIVEMLPGCGRVCARDLLQHFGTVRRIVNATPDELRALRGIGARKAAQIHKVLNADYQAIDTERNLEDAIQTEPDLLFDRPVTPVARQHHIYTEAKERHVVDMVFLDPDADEVILVELKRGKLTAGDVRQLRRYLDHASESKLLRPFLQRGARIRGILATAEPCTLEPKDPDVSVRIVDRKRAITVLKHLRHHRFSDHAAPAETEPPAKADHLTLCGPDGPS